jgi:hypothetical protein
MTRASLTHAFKVVANHQNRQEPKRKPTYGSKPYGIGDKVEITEIVRGQHGLHDWKRKGKVIYVSERFVTVDFGRYRECFWTDCDRNNTEIRRVSR